MDQKKIYISRKDFHESDHYKKLERRVNTCLMLIKRLIDHNQECERVVREKWSVESYIIDYRIDQFKLFHNTLCGIYFGCYASKDTYNASIHMNAFKIDTTIYKALLAHQKMMTLAAIVQVYSMLEFTRKDFEKNIKGKDYFSQLKLKYPGLGDSLSLLYNLRNTIHSDSKWEKDTPLVYRLLKGEVTIKKGDYFEYDHWTIYKLFRDGIELAKQMALDNEPNLVRNTHFNLGKHRIAVVQLKNFDKNDFVNRLREGEENAESV
ncbi:MAG: hypothetical protein JNK08_00395 [Sediminibacterium sp.]|nr:hypothetical protein [Sediminibacterium sp.]